MTTPARHWRSDGDEPLPSGAEALSEPFRAFPSWFLRIECDRCGKVQMVNEAHARWRADPRHLQAAQRARGQGGAAHRHRGRQQPLGPEDRADRRLRRRRRMVTTKGRGASLVTTHDKRTSAIIEAELLEARRELQRWQQSFGRYTGNNPNEFSAEIRRARAVVRRLEAELRRTKAR